MELTRTITPSLAMRSTALAIAAAATLVAQPAYAQRAAYWEMAKAQAAAHNVPESLVHRVIMRESKYQAHLIGRGNTIGLMQIKLPTARGVGYRGDAAGLRNPETNLTYGVRYLAGAYRMAGGNHDRAVALYARGYNYNARRYGSLTAVRTAALSTKPAIDEASSAQAQPSEPDARIIAALPTKRVPVPRAKPDAIRSEPGNSDVSRADISTSPFVSPESVTAEIAAAHASVAAQPMHAPAVPTPREEPPKGALARLWDNLTGWARR